MGIQCKPMGVMRSHFKKMENEAFKERQKSVKANKPEKKTKKTNK